MVKMFKSLFYTLLLINIYFLVSCCTAGKEVPPDNSLPEQTETQVRLETFLVLEKGTEITSPWADRFLLPSAAGAFSANDFTFSKGIAKLENSSIQYGQRVREQVKVEQLGGYAVYRITVELVAVRQDKALTTAYTHAETISSEFTLTELAKDGKVLYQPERYALLKSIKTKAVPRGQIGLKKLEYLSNGRFKAEAVIKY